jgi:O-antigen ligase
MILDRVWAWLVALFFLICLFSGGNLLPTDQRMLVLSLLSLGFLVPALFRLRRGFPSRSAVFVSILLALSIGLMFLQLVPLPPSVWHLFPGRQFLANGLESVDLAQSWMPLSLSPLLTRQDILSILPACAGFTAVLSLAPTRYRDVAIAVMLAALICVLVALAQKFQGPNGYFNFYDHKVIVLATGFFANRNILAAQLYSTIPLIVALIVHNFQNRNYPPRLFMVFGGVLILVMIAGIGATGSRTGTILGMVGVFLSLLLFRNALVWFKPGTLSLPTIIGSFLFLVVFAQLCFIALLRLANADNVTELRPEIYATSLEAVKSFFPIGSGFGSFVPVYALFERPEKLLDVYINHAHNDWIELILEGGLAMALILAAGLICFVGTSFSLFRNASTEVISKAAAISAGLLLIHSAIEYPIRAPAIMALFGIFGGMMCNARLAPKRNQQSRAAAESKVNTSEGVIAFRPRPSGFAKKTTPDQ